ncbi:hypothetical protein GCM10009530_43050 [Microbispora corallina]|uniref:Uncharacterized protein n=1 Tax=Microbispora corallina TaxID=83302 RepID=A0ABQ4G118_9ACTN|nr:hypothetical protein Mco01_37660 [Microbispora corallina]
MTSSGTQASAGVPAATTRPPAASAAAQATRATSLSCSMEHLFLPAVRPWRAGGNAAGALSVPAPRIGVMSGKGTRNMSWLHATCRVIT